jgi:hypothetical protein
MRSPRGRGAWGSKAIRTHEICNPIANLQSPVASRNTRSKENQRNCFHVGCPSAVVRTRGSPPKPHLAGFPGPPHGSGPVPPASYLPSWAGQTGPSHLCQRLSELGSSYRGLSRDRWERWGSAREERDGKARERKAGTASADFILKLKVQRSFLFFLSLCLGC